MSDSPDEIRAEIERTRQDLGLDVDALADKVSPSKIVDRQVDKVRGAFGSVRERIMGAADDASASASSSASGMGDTAKGIAHDVKAKAEGAPLAVGLIAFGLGLLLAGVFPASRKEKEMAGAVKDKAQPLVDELGSVAKEVAADLKEPAMDAAAAVKDRAADAVESVKSDTTDAVGAVTDRAQEARANVAES